VHAKTYARWYRAVLLEVTLAAVRARYSAELKNVVLMCPAINLIDASALESLEAIAHRLDAADVGFHLSEVKGPVMDALKRSDFFDHFKGKVFLSQHEAMRALAPSPNQVVHTLQPAAEQTVRVS